MLLYRAWTCSVLPPVVVGVQLMVMVVFAPAASVVIVCVPVMCPLSHSSTVMLVAGAVPLLVMVMFMG